MTPTVFVAWDGDGIGQLVGRARLANDVAAIRRASAAIDRGNAVFTGWALASAGNVVEAGGDEGLVEVPAASLGELEGTRRHYGSAAGAPASVGVGKTPAEASQALLAAKLRGKDRVVLFGESIPKEIQELQDRSEADKLKDEYLGKADAGAATATPGKTAPTASSAEHSEGQAALAGAAAPTAPDPEASPSLQAFRAAAGAQDQADRAAAVQRSGDLDALKQQTAQALADLKQQLPVLQQLKQAYPDTYAAVTALAQSVVGLARGLQDQSAALQKAIRLPGQRKPLAATETDPALTFPAGAALDKEALPSETPHKMVALPVGTLHNGKIKIAHGDDGKTAWRGVRAGMIAAQDPGGVGGGGANTHAVSSREPNSK